MLDDSILGDAGAPPASAQRSRQSTGRLGGSNDPRAREIAKPRRAESGPIRRLAVIGKSLTFFVRSDLDRSRLIAAALLGCLAVLLIAGAGQADQYFHRGTSISSQDGLVLHPTGRELATNVDLTVIQPSQLDGVAEQLQIAGFRYVRQPIVWSTVEPRQGTLDWSRYDPIVESLSERGITIVATLRGTPAWARPPGTAAAADTPPADMANLSTFAQAVITRYGVAQIPFLQIWDRPNEPANWGGAGGVESTYPAMVSTVATAVRELEPSIRVVLADFEPFPSGGQTDLDALSEVYRSGISGAFDVVTATVDGGGRSPFDRGVSATRLNLSRAVLVREIMDRAGDRAKPVWAARYGWSAGAADHQVTPPQQAAFVIDGIERAREEWPWMGPMFMWNFLPIAGDPSAQYALLTTDGRSTELFSAISAFARTAGAEAAPTGFAPVDARSMQYQGRWTSQDLPSQVYRTTSATNDTVTVNFDGSALTVFLRQNSEAGSIRMTLDGAVVDEIPATSLQTLQALNVPIELVSGLDSGLHTLTLTLTSEGDMTVGGAIVGRERSSLWPVALLTIAGTVLLFVAIKDIVYIAARRTGHLRRSSQVDPWFDRGRSPRLSPRMQQ